jgi:hypothetical protein
LNLPLASSSSCNREFPHDFDFSETDNGYLENSYKQNKTLCPGSSKQLSSVIQTEESRLETPNMFSSSLDDVAVPGTSDNVSSQESIDKVRFDQHSQDFNTNESRVGFDHDSLTDKLLSVEKTHEAENGDLDADNEDVLSSQTATTTSSLDDKSLECESNFSESLVPSTPELQDQPIINNHVFIKAVEDSQDKEAALNVVIQRLRQRQEMGSKFKAEVTQTMIVPTSAIDPRSSISQKSEIDQRSLNPESDDTRMKSDGNDGENEDSETLESKVVQNLFILGLNQIDEVQSVII